MPPSGKRSHRLVEICLSLNAHRYLSAAGSRAYIEEEGAFASEGMPVEYQHFNCRPYPQKGVREFVPYLSVIDIYANVGSGSSLKHFSS